MEIALKVSKLKQIYNRLPKQLKLILNVNKQTKKNPLQSNFDEISLYEFENSSDDFYYFINLSKWLTLEPIAVNLEATLTIQILSNRTWTKIIQFTIPCIIGIARF